MIIGIDLGTTNSLAAAWKNGEAQIIPNALGEATARGRRWSRPCTVC